MASTRRASTDDELAQAVDAVGALSRSAADDGIGHKVAAQLALEAFSNQQEELLEAPPDLLAAWHWLTGGPADAGFDLFFESLRRSPRPSDAEAREAIQARLDGTACRAHAREAMAAAARHGWALAYALAWLWVSGDNSVMPPWVRHQFHEAGHLVRRLRDRACEDQGCPWCRERHNACKELKRFFNFDSFRPEPADQNGRPLQQAIVEAAMAGRHVLGILPTGTGKSLCYQIPALSRYDKTGAVTVVISPLVALMADQVAGLETSGIDSCVTINGMLSTRITTEPVADGGRDGELARGVGASEAGGPAGEVVREHAAGEPGAVGGEPS